MGTHAGILLEAKPPKITSASMDAIATAINSILLAASSEQMDQETVKAAINAFVAVATSGGKLPMTNVSNCTVDMGR